MPEMGFDVITTDDIEISVMVKGFSNVAYVTVDHRTLLLRSLDQLARSHLPTKVCHGGKAFLSNH